MTLDPRLLERAITAGLGAIGESGTPEGTQFGRGVRRRDLGLEPIPRRFYPGQGELLQDFRKMSAMRNQEMLGEAIQGVFDQPFQETFGFTRSPLGNTVEPFFKLKLNQEMPFELSSVYPVLRDPKETEAMYKRFASYAQSRKFPAIYPEIQGAYFDLRRFNNDLSMVVELGLSKGPKFHTPTIEQAFKHAILLEAAGTVPASADMGIGSPEIQGALGDRPHRAPRGEGIRARDTRIMKRMAELGMLKAKGRMAGGPLTAEAFRTFQRLLGPSVGLRMGRGLFDIPLTPGLPADTPMTAMAQRNAPKELLAEASYERRALVAKEVAALTPEQKYERLMSVLGKNVPQDKMKEIVVGAAGGTSSHAEASALLARLNPEARFKAVARETRNVLGEEAAVSTLERVAQSMKASTEVGDAPSRTRLTRQAIESGVVDQEAVLRAGNKVAKKLKPVTGGIRNPLAVLAMAAILSAGFMAAGGSDGEA